VADLHSKSFQRTVADFLAYPDTSQIPHINSTVGLHSLQKFLNANGKEACANPGYHDLKQILTAINCPVSFLNHKRHRLRPSGNTAGNASEVAISFYTMAGWQPVQQMCMTTRACTNLKMAPLSFTQFWCTCKHHLFTIQNIRFCITP